MISNELKSAVMQDIVLLSTVGIRVVLVHGGGPEINAMLKKIGKESKSWAACGIPTARQWMSWKWCSPVK